MSATKTMNAKKIDRILPSPEMHWVGDGFPVSSVISPQTVQTRMSPFVLMDYAGPARFEPARTPRGVDSHPHRGFETVTVVYQGELEHRDTAGNSGSIGPGDVQWMTAAAGVLHEEKHSAAFTQRGGVMEMAQLWVNLPASHKMSPPRYQELRAGAIPTVMLPDDAGSVRVIAGEFDTAPGAATTVTPVILWDAKMRAGARASLPIPAGFNAAIYVRRGPLRIGDSVVRQHELALLDRDGDAVTVRAEGGEVEFLVLAGQPIDEPVVAYGPFVMNTPEEIQQAVRDLRAGKFGELD